MTTRIETLEQLAAVPVHSVLVDRIGVAWQAVSLGSDTSWHKSGADTRRVGFCAAGNHVVYELDQVAAGVLPMRVIDDGQAEPLGRE